MLLLKISVLASGLGSKTSVAEVAKAVPFLGILMGFSYSGHAVWIFDGEASQLIEGCRDADVLIVDSAVVPTLEPGWQDQVAKAMRNVNILIHERADFKLRIVRKAGAADGPLEFPN
jgi:hypothetical protein